MKFCDLETIFAFGKYEGMNLKQIFEISPIYVEWCLINLEHMFIVDEVMNELKQLNQSFSFSTEAIKKNIEKYEKYVNYYEDL